MAANMTAGTTAGMTANIKTETTEGMTADMTNNTQLPSGISSAVDIIDADQTGNMARPEQGSPFSR
jgi:hypothetical protein